jgi:hypothetical protein
MLGHEHEQRARVLVDERARAADGVDEVECELLGLHAVTRLDVDDRPDHEGGHDALGGVVPELGVERRPRALLLVLADQRRVLRRRALRGLVELVRV